MESVELRVKYLDEDLPKLKFVDGAISNWIDMCAAETVVLHKGDFALIPLGVCIELPRGYEAHLAPRSSTFKRWGLLQTNSVGVIDEMFCGDDDEWKMPVYATRDTIVEKGNRICQFRIMKIQPDITFVSVASLGSRSRGSFGSTGV